MLRNAEPGRLQVQPGVLGEEVRPACFPARARRSSLPPPPPALSVSFRGAARSALPRRAGSLMSSPGAARVPQDRVGAGRHTIPVEALPLPGPGVPCPAIKIAGKALHEDRMPPRSTRPGSPPQVNGESARAVKEGAAKTPTRISQDRSATSRA